MASELFYTELQCLAYFNHSVTFPFLNMVEKCSQSDLVGILPTLYNELCQGNLLTLQEYVVNMRGVIVQKPDDELSSYILGKMCKAAADGIKLQCNVEGSMVLHMHTKCFEQLISPVWLNHNCRDYQQII